MKRAVLLRYAINGLIDSGELLQRTAVFAKVVQKGVEIEKSPSPVLTNSL